MRHLGRKGNEWFYGVSEIIWKHLPDPTQVYMATSEGTHSHPPPGTVSSLQIPTSWDPAGKAQRCLCGQCKSAGLPSLAALMPVVSPNSDADEVNWKLVD